MRYHPIRAPAEFTPVFAKMLSGVAPESELEYFVQGQLEHSGYLPAGRFFARHKEPLRLGKKIPVLVHSSESPFLWISADPRTSQIGAVWMDLGGAILCDYRSVALGYSTRRPPGEIPWRPLYRLLRRKLHHCSFVFNPPQRVALT